MTTQQLRDKIIEKKALDAKTKKESEQGCAEMQKLFASITEEMKEELAAMGFDLQEIVNVDFEKLKTDRNYNKEYNKRLNEFVINLHQVLEEQVKRW